MFQMNELSAYLNDPRVIQYLDSLRQQPNQFAQNIQPPQSPPNYFRNNETGNVVEFGPSQPMQQPAQIDYSQPQVEVIGGVKGYRSKNDPSGIYDQSGNKLSEIGFNRNEKNRRLLEDLNIAGKLAGVEEQRLKNREIEQKIQTQRGDSTTGRPEGLKLKQGEVWNPQTRAVESVPGSELYTQQSGRHAKDLETMKTAKSTSQLAIEKIDEITKGNLGENYSDSFQNNFGGYNAILSQYIPGETTDVRKKIEALKSNLKTAGLQMMRQGGSIGQMTEREWPIVEQAIASISPLMSEKEAAFQLAKVRTYMQNLAQRAEETYNTEWGNTQFGRQAQPPSISDVGQNKPSSLVDQIPGQNKRIIRTGTANGRKVIQYDDGTIQYAN